MSVGSKKIGMSLIWNFGEKLFSQGIQLLISTILARILMPDDYGILALVMVFISVLTVFVETGLGAAVIQKKDIERGEIDQFFTINLLVAIVLYTAIFFLAPLIASFYSNFNSDLLRAVIRVFAVTLPIGALTSIQSSILYRKFDFKKSFFINIVVVIVSGGAGIVMACFGFGVWALVVQQIASKLLLGLILLFVLEWKPVIRRPQKSILGSLRFSTHILFNRLIVVIYNQFRSLFIGKWYSATDLAFYNKGETFPSMIATNTDYSLQKVMFSAYSREQDDLERIKSLIRRTISLSSFLLAPVMLGLAAAAHNIVLVLLTEKWLPCADYMRYFCLIYMFQPIRTAGSQALDGMGKSRVTFIVGLVSKAIGVVFLLIAFRFGVKAIVIATLVTEALSLPLYFYINKKYIGYKLSEQLADLFKNIMPALFVALLIAAAGYLSRFIGSALLVLIIQIVIGIAAYILLAKLFKNESMEYIVQKIRSVRKKE